MASYTIYGASVGNRSKSYLEHYVEFFMKTHGANSLSQREVQAAINLLKGKLGDPEFNCCEDDASFINPAATVRRSTFMLGFDKILRMTNRQTNMHSLTRTQRLLEGRLSGAECCIGRNFS